MKNARTSAIRRPHPDKAGGKLIQVSFSDQNSPSCFNSGNARRILFSHIREHRTTSGGRKVCGVDIVFNCERYAEQGTGRCAAQSLGGFQSLLFRDKVDPDRVVGKHPDPSVNFPDHVAGCETARAVVCLK